MEDKIILEVIDLKKTMIIFGNKLKPGIVQLISMCKDDMQREGKISDYNKMEKEILLVIKNYANLVEKVGYTKDRKPILEVYNLI